MIRLCYIVKGKEYTNPTLTSLTRDTSDLKHLTDSAALLRNQEFAV